MSSGEETVQVHGDSKLEEGIAQCLQGLIADELLAGL